MSVFYVSGPSKNNLSIILTFKTIAIVLRFKCLESVEIRGDARQW